jgi:uncharacterized protein DUF1707
VPVTAGPKDPAAASRDQLRAGHADREQVIETLKDAFVHGRLTRDELDTRAGRALTAPTRADLAALTADIPAVPSAPAAPELARPPTPARRGPLARAAAGSGGCLVLAFAAVRVAFIFDPGGAGPDPYHSWAKPFMLLAVVAVLTALGIVVLGVATSVERRRSRRQLPPRPGPGGHALEAGQSTGHGPALLPDRPDQTRADLRSDSSRPGRPHSSRRGVRAPRGIRPVPDAG